MSWKDTYREHPVWQAARDASNALSGYQSRDDLDEDAVDGVELLEVLIAQVMARADSPHPSLTPFHLDQVQKIVTHIEESALGNNVEAALVDTALPENASINLLGEYVRSWPATEPTELRALHEELEAYRRSFSVARETIGKNTDEAEERIKEISKEALLQFGEVKNIGMAIQAQLNENDQYIEQQKQRIDTAVTTHQETFTTSQERRAEEWKATKEDYDQSAQEFMDSLAKYQKKAETVVSHTGITATASDYLEYVEKQDIAANRWRTWAFLAFAVAAVSFLSLVFLPYFGFALPGQGSDWYELALQKLGAPIGVGAVGAYCARESGKHREQARTAKQTQLMLTALEPFIADMPESQKEVVRFETARRVFSGKNDKVELPEKKSPGEPGDAS